MTGDFSENDKIKCLLWCNRHCCLCGKACGTNIEIAHILYQKEKVDQAILLMLFHFVSIVTAKLGDIIANIPKATNID